MNFRSGEACYVRGDENDDFRRQGDGGLRIR
jgi:hypothetical protein